MLRNNFSLTEAELFAESGKVLRREKHKPGVMPTAARALRANKPQAAIPKRRMIHDHQITTQRYKKSPP